MLGRDIELLGRCRYPFQSLYVKTAFAEHLYQERRRAGGEPELAVPSVIQAAQQAERVVYVLALRAEMVPVIHLLQMLQSLFVCLPVLLRQGLDVRPQLLLDLPLRNPADGTEAVLHADVLQAVQLAEDAHLAELAYPRDEHEPPRQG